MRFAALLLPLFLLAGCIEPPTEAYDPNLYDANGHVVSPVAAAQPQPSPLPQPPPRPPVPECRQVPTTVVIGGQPQEAYETACRQPDGSWRFTN